MVPDSEGMHCRREEEEGHIKLQSSKIPMRNGLKYPV
jgi:hypothetical protein